jgi:hypothetical protein
MDVTERGIEGGSGSGLCTKVDFGAGSASPSYELQHCCVAYLAFSSLHCRRRQSLQMSRSAGTP